FLIFQTGETKKHYEVSEYYFSSGLVAIEVPRYVAYREGRLLDSSDSFHPQELDEETLVSFYLDMERDYYFLKKLNNDEIITPSNPEYAQWKFLRTEYESKRNQIISLRYGFRPAYGSLLTAFTYMFLHGSAGHLFGNMIFLWIVGCMLEMGLGRFLYSGLYIFGGLAAAGLFGLIYMHSTVPVVGASGAIAGLMGAFAVLFGRKRVKIFYSLGFYFNYLKIPGIILLPIWIGNEFFQLFFGSARHVAYVAHIGGLMGGALLGFISLKFSLAFNEDVFDEVPEDEISPLIEKALNHIAELDMETGSQILEQVLTKDPENVDALTHLFNIYKLDPEDEKFHKTSKKLLFQLSRSYDTYEKAYQIYQEYLRHTHHPRLSPQLYVQLSAIFAATGQLESAVKILALLIKKVPESPGIPTALLKLARAYRQNGMAGKGTKCLQLICHKYPETTEAQVARKSLQN
ncbi:MAG: rhomboid family intramembrane serine protease, partial [Deltaproteobacteria bacterium]|nr:rhomboid family intramembrane serine protease [Deltaproteobacteria bacterium]